jgi:hypothetical protein
MIISSELKKIDDNRENLPKGEYLYIYSENNSKPIIIPFSEFQGLYQEAKNDFALSPLDPVVSSVEHTTTIREQNNIPNFERIMKYLMEKIVINENDFDNDANELIIESSLGDFLELPWEKVTEKEICVLRRAGGGKKSSPYEYPNNLLFVISNSNLSSEVEFADLEKELKGEIQMIVNEVNGTVPKLFKVDNLHISKHTTIDSFKLLPWNEYNYVHMIMHGDKNGGLCLEKADIDHYKSQDVISIEEVMSVLKDRNFLLMFFSLCNSGGCIFNRNSLAFRVVNEGIAKYTIGYRYGVGEKYAFSFSEIFYHTLLSGAENSRVDRLERVYRRSLSEYYKGLGADKKYIPILYIN